MLISEISSIFVTLEMSCVKKSAIQIHTKKISRLQTYFGSLKDPLRTTKGNFYFPLDEILFLVISAALCGADSWVSINPFGKFKQEWLRQYLPYKNGIPSHDVLGKEFALIDPKAFNECFGIRIYNSLKKFFYLKKWQKHPTFQTSLIPSRK